ncbi:MAG: nucleoside 2-deoxyribosyltransferase [Anaerolineales bacterium]|nr:nucleoside 2-deoxyribosyltransferase [Anaerolineales bacterium]
MEIYFGCSITGGRNQEREYQQIVKYLIEAGHQVPTAHLSRPDVMELELVVDPVQVYNRDIQWIDNCQVMVAEVSTSSHGVGYEICYALMNHKPVLCLHKIGIRVSKMITGNKNPLLRVMEYKSTEHLPALLKDFLEEI